ncbi:MAG: hypothetical protein U0599_05440, partial [Vicinamibacteria bacterium]
MSRRTAVLAFVLVALAGPSRAQTPKLALLIPDLYGPKGLTVGSEARLPDGSTHSAHFNSAFQSRFTQFNVALASQLAAIPLPSPASGFTYTFDETLGTYQRTTQSFGPILAERPETLGRNKFSFGVSYQHFGFDTIEGVNLGAVPAVFTHDDAQLGGGRADVVTTATSIDAKVDQTVASFTYGLANWLDASLAVPFVRVDLGVNSVATIQRVGTTNPAIHFYGNGSGDYGTTADYGLAGSASGIGDLVLRLKARAVTGQKAGLALGLDVRVPTGDEENLLGLGTTGVKPFAALAVGFGHAALHVNAGYLWNGKSVLAGDVQKGTKADMPDQFTWAAGIDWGVTKRLTFAVDVLGNHVTSSPRMVSQTFTAANGKTFPQIDFVSEAYSIINGAAGMKVNLGGRLLLDANVLFKLNDAGLRDKVTPLVGIE